MQGCEERQAEGATSWGGTTIVLPDESATAALAARLALIARIGDVLALSGPLGAGKSVFARSFIRARGRPDEEVPSPTFTLVQMYPPTAPLDGTVYHFDCFRLTAPEEAYELGIEEAMIDGICLIEWPERVLPLLSPHRLNLAFRSGQRPESRRVAIGGGGDWRQRLAEAGIG
jgi:tRNA threonylcarbamoyladenosine biosynthesis protein TsaE